MHSGDTFYDSIWNVLLIFKAFEIAQEKHYRVGKISLGFNGNRVGTPRNLHIPRPGTHLYDVHARAVRMVGFPQFSLSRYKFPPYEDGASLYLGHFLDGPLIKDAGTRLWQALYHRVRSLWQGSSEIRYFHRNRIRQQTGLFIFIFAQG